MRPRLGPPTVTRPSLPDHLRTRLWGPAEFVGMPPRRRLLQGLAAGTAGVTAILGGAVLGAWRGFPALADGAFGLVCAAVLTAYLLFLRAGRALVGVVAVLAVFLALRSPQAAAGVVLAERGKVESAVVTSIEDGRPDASRPRRLCTVQDSDGAVLPVRIWRGCEGRTRPGDVLAVLYDPEGRLPPRGAGSGVSVSGSLAGLAGCVAALVLGCLVAVVRSHRLVHAVPAFREPAR